MLNAETISEATPATTARRARLGGAALRPLVLAAMLAVASVPALTMAGQGYRGSGPGHDGRNDGPHDNRGYVYDGRYGHNHYYPPRGYAVGALPRGYVTVNYRGGPYYYHGGVWYRPYGPRFVVVRPAVGLFVPFLPSFYTTVWFGGVPYYYADDVYYSYRAGRGYEVVDPPGGAAAQGTTSAPGKSANDLFIYPKNGQSEEQQGKDKYECHSWASNQSGFDPTQPSGGVAEDQAASKRDDYNRAMQACLEARGYSVK